MTDIEIEFICTDCEASFAEALGEMPAGTVLKCPMCHSIALTVADADDFSPAAGPEGDGGEAGAG